MGRSHSGPGLGFWLHEGQCGICIPLSRLTPPRAVVLTRRFASLALVSSQALGLSSNTTIYIAGGKPHEVFEHGDEAFDTTRALFPDSQFPKVRHKTSRRVCLHI